MTKGDHKHKEAVAGVPLTAVFVRHGQASPDKETGGLGPPLSGLGDRQAALVAKRLSTESFSHIYSSDLARARQTAAAIVKHHSHLPWTITDALREISSQHFAPGSMPMTLALRRDVREERKTMERFILQVLRFHVPGERILIVCHGNIIRSMVPLFAGRRPEQSVMMDISNTAVTILDIWSNGEGVLKLANCVRHLIPREVT